MGQNQYDNGSMFEEESIEQEETKEEAHLDFGCKLAGFTLLKGGRSGKYCTDQGASIITCKDDSPGGFRSAFIFYYCKGGKIAFKGMKFRLYCMDTEEGVKCNQDRIRKNGLFKHESQG